MEIGNVFLHGRSQIKEKMYAFAKLTVNCPVGVTVRATSVGMLNTPKGPAVFDVVSDNGVAIFNKLPQGVWDITFVGVEYTPIKRVEIDSLDNDIVMRYVEPRIHVTYPEGSICTCSDGNTVFTAPDTSGYCTFTVFSTGEWTITSVVADLSASETVNVTADFRNYIVNLKYFEATIDITFPAGSSCEITDGEHRYSLPSYSISQSGRWTCVVNYPGVWTVTCEDYYRTAFTTVMIESNGQNESVILEYYEATINITYPVGSECYVTNGRVILSPPDDNGVWTCNVPSAGTWTVNCLLRGESSSKTVYITTEGQSVSVEMTVWTTILDRETQEYSVVEKLLQPVNSSTLSAVEDAYPYVKMYVSGDADKGAWQILSAIDCSACKTLMVTGYSMYGEFGIAGSRKAIPNSEVCEMASNMFTTSESECVIDMSDTDGIGYIGFVAHSKATPIYLKSVKVEWG